MAKVIEILKITVKIDLEVVLVDMVEISLQNQILHTKIRLTHASNPIHNGCVTVNNNSINVRLVYAPTQ